MFIQMSEYYMDKEIKEKIDQIAAKIECSKDFRCVKHDFTEICRAKDVRLEEHLECLDEKAYECPFSISYGNSYYCRCPLRVYLCKELKK